MEHAVNSLLERPGGRNIFISTNCASELLGAVFHAIFPADQIDAGVQLRGNEDEAVVREFAGRLSAADIWVRYCDTDALVTNPIIEPLLRRLISVDIPHLNFSAFHPDLTYAERSSGELVDPHYNSAILVWAYRHRIDPTDAKRLFNAATFRELGYFSTWDASVRSLSANFDHCNLDFSRFFLHVKRMGAFMHTVNHPRAEALVAFAKTISVKLGAGHEVHARKIDITDPLTDSYQWPIYPEIAVNYSIPGQYDWVIEGKHYTLDEFVESSFTQYIEAGVSPNDIEAVAPIEIRSHFDRVLRDQVKALA